MLEIVFNQSVFGSMEQAAINATHRKPENLFCFPLPLDRGDIRKEFAAAREPLAALLAQAKDTPLRIWSSDAPQEKCGLYWLVAQLEPLGWENLDVSLVELPAFLEREDGVVVQYRAWGEVCPEEWSRWKTAGVRLPSPLLRAMAGSRHPARAGEGILPPRPEKNHAEIRQKQAPSSWTGPWSVSG